MSSTSIPLRIEDVRKRCNDAIAEAFENDSPVLIDALPAIGKSTGVVHWAAETENKLAVFTERHDLYGDYTERAEEKNLTVYRLPSFSKDCPTAHEDAKHGKRWKKKFMKEFNRGRSARNIHKNSAKIFGKKLPCQKSGECDYIERLDEDFEDYDIVVGNFLHAYHEEYFEGRYTVLDESPGTTLIQEFSSDRVSESVSDYLDMTDELPFEYWEDILSDHDPANPSPAVRSWLKEQAETEEEYWQTLIPLDKKPRMHRLAPLFLRIALAHETLENGWWRAEVDDRTIGVRYPKKGKMYILNRLSLDAAESVVALDGTPSPEMWQTLFTDEIVHRPLLTDSEKRDYIRHCLGLRIIQTTFDSKPYRSGEYVSEMKDMALIEKITAIEGGAPALISSKQALEEYEFEGLNDLIPSERRLHYAALKGTNEFATVRLGMVIGSPHPNDIEVIMWGALVGESVERVYLEDKKSTNRRYADYGSYGNTILETLRDYETLQAVMRFGREADETGHGATVYVHTRALPNWVRPERQIATFHMWDGEQGDAQVIKAIKSLDSWQTREFTTKEVAQAVEGLELETRSAIKYDNILKRLKNFAEHGYLTKEKRGRGYIWRNHSLEESSRFGHVTLE